MLHIRIPFHERDHESSWVNSRKLCGKKKSPGDADALHRPRRELHIYGFRRHEAATKLGAPKIEYPLGPHSLRL